MSDEFNKWCDEARRSGIIAGSYSLTVAQAAWAAATEAAQGRENELLQKMQRLEEVLRFYAHERNYFGGLCQETEIGKDCGRIARETLKDQGAKARDVVGEKK